MHLHELFLFGNFYARGVGFVALVLVRSTPQFFMSAGRFSGVCLAVGRMVEVLINECGSHIERDLAVIDDTFVLYLRLCFLNIFGNSHKVVKNYEGYGNTSFVLICVFLYKTSL